MMSCPLLGSMLLFERLTPKFGLFLLDWNHLLWTFFIGLCILSLLLSILYLCIRSLFFFFNENLILHIHT